MKIIVKVKPGAKIEKVEKISRLIDGGDGIYYSVCVKEPAKEGKANKAIIAALAKHFGVAKSSVSIISGAASRIKIVEIKETND